jgi:hypothetical protein
LIGPQGTPVLQNGDASITVVDLAGERSHFSTT